MFAAASSYPRATSQKDPGLASRPSSDWKPALRKLDSAPCASSPRRSAWHRRRWCAFGWRPRSPGGIALKTDLGTAAIVIGALLLADAEVDDIMARRAGPSS